MAQSHLHKMSYWGELDAEPVIAWLNKRHGPEDDPVRQLIELCDPLEGLRRAQDHRTLIAQLIRKTVRRWNFAMVPIVGNEPAGGWTVEWRHRCRPSVPADQLLAFGRALNLANRGLLLRVRRCQRCDKYFYARFRHQLFDSLACQQVAFRTDPTYKRRRADEMKRLRAEAALQEQRWLNRKGKNR